LFVLAHPASNKPAATAMAAAAIAILPTMTISSSWPVFVVSAGHPVCDRHHRFVQFLEKPASSE
jgi:hypothetical protein